MQVFIIVLMSMLSGGVALAGEGRCDYAELQDFYLPIGPDGKVDRPQTVKVISDETPVFESADATTAVSTLPFNKSLRVVDMQGRRVLVVLESTYTPLGWVDRSALLCGTMPLKGQSGLEQKLYIRTATEVRQATPTTVKAYPAPEMTDCGASGCHELSRFSGYFVFDVETGQADGQPRYLLSESYRLVDTSQLVGWVSGENGFVWDTAYGMRPGENLVFPPGHELEGQERAICAYQNLDNAFQENPDACLPILGGDRWYLSEHRIPVLERIEQQGKKVYRVVLPLAGTGARKEGDRLVVQQVKPEDWVANEGIESLQKMKHVDVMFLIDGTKSMRHHIQAVKGDQAAGRQGVVQHIMTTLQEEDAFQEAQFRFGFRIYRDTYAGPLELGEGLPLSPACELSVESREQNARDFEAAIDRVAVSEEASDDYAENVFGGIRQAIRDLAPCPENTKLLFVIGDCGYDAEAQQRRGVTPILPDELVLRMKGGDGFKNIVTFFIQTPKDSASAGNPQRYEAAFELFTQQARDLLSQLLQTDDPAELQPAEINNYLLTTDAANLNEKILEGVKQFSNMEIINELALDLRGGTALKDAIERLQGSEAYNNIPGLFWDLVEQGSCGKLGEQCQDRIYDTIIEAYIPVSDDVVEDIWLQSDDLDKWVSILRDFDNERLSGLPGSELRQAFVLAMRDSLEKVIRKPMYQDTGEPLKEYLKRKGGLPVSDTSPLFGYSIADLQDPYAVPDCEIIRLTTWVNNAKQMLNIVYHGDLRPIYTAEPFPGECPTGQNIPFISGDILSAPLGKNAEMRYNHSFKGANVYWVPKEFLP